MNKLIFIKNKEEFFILKFIIYIFQYKEIIYYKFQYKELNKEYL